jgi:signal transduction histidine kinase/DNA-binding response OmpR family regulator
MTVRVLIVEDSAVLIRLVETYLDASEVPFRHHAVSRLSQALEYLRNHQLDVVLMDLGLPDSVGLAGVTRVQEVADCPVIVMSGQDDPATALEALRLGAQDYLFKGEFGAEQLIRAIQYARARQASVRSHTPSPRDCEDGGEGPSIDCDKLQRAEGELRRRNAELSALNTIAGIASRSFDLDVVLGDTLDAVMALDLFESEKGSFALLDDDAAELRVVVQRGMPDDIPCVDQAMPLEACMCGQAVLEEKVIVSRCAHKEVVEARQCPDLPANLDVSVPLIAHDRVLGVLNLWLDPEEMIEERDIELLEAIAGQIALAIENIHRYEAEREQRILAEQSRDEILHNERLAATGRLTASLAHELSNPLQAIHNSLEMILSFSFSREEIQDYVRMADEEVERLVEMVNRILDFSRRPGERFEILDVNRVAKTVIDLAKKYLEHRHVTLRESLDRHMPPVEGNATTLGQVVLNLIINGVEAMPGGGTLTISTRHSNNEHVEICVADSGVGIPEDELSRIFEPFYSTKADGTGLGLSISHSIVSQHQGEIQVESEVGEGTSFIVRLPVHSNEAGDY